MSTQSITSRVYSIRYKGLAQQLVSNIYISDAALQLEKPENDGQGIIQCQGLWDTGATNTVVSSRIIDRLKLPVVSRTHVGGVNGEFETTIHMIDLWLPNFFVIRKVLVTKGILTSEIDALIGMDVITMGDFAISNFQGMTIFSYRSPSIADTDYVKQAELLHQAKVNNISRNAPCPCGSGRKYKNCCGKNKI